MSTTGKTGRRPGGSTREAILQAARVEFAAHGFRGATVRAIGARAGADPALIRHFFGGKQGLFMAALELPPEPRREIRGAFDAPVDQWGEQLTRAYLTLWEDPGTAGPLQATAASAFSDPQAMERMREFIGANLQDIARRLPGEDPTLRITLAMSHIVGVVMVRHLVRMEPLASSDLEVLVASIGPVVQQCLTGPLPRVGEPDG